MNPGDYRVTPVPAESGISEAKSGNLQAFVLLRVIEDQPGAAIGDSITWFGSFTEAAMARTREQLEIMGVTSIDDAGTLNGIGDVPGAPGEPLIVIVQVKQETYDGKLQTKAGFVRRVGDSAVRVARVSERGKIAAAQALFTPAPQARAITPSVSVVTNAASARPSVNPFAKR